MAADHKQLTARREPADGGAAWAEAQHARGRLTARERVELLLDAGSCTELGMLVAQDGSCIGDGVVTVQGTIGGRPVCVFAKDMSVSRGTLAEVHGRKICRLQELALESRIPVIGMFDTAGIRLEAGMSALTGYGAIARNSVAASGVIPQISLILGGCPGADALLPPLSDFVFMANDDSSLFVSGPDVVKVVTFVDAPGFLPGTAQEHGGLAKHAAKLLFAYAQATVPLVTVVVRKAFGAAGAAMGSRAIGADLLYAWPDAQIGLLGAKGAAVLRGAAGDAAGEQDYAHCPFDGRGGRRLRARQVRGRVLVWRRPRVHREIYRRAAPY